MERTDDGPSDAHLLARCGRGDARAWDVLLARYGPLIFSIARRYGASPTDADDIFQNVCRLLLENLTRIREPERLAGWIAATTRHEASRFLRRDAGRGEFSLDSATGDADPLADRLVDPGADPEATTLALEEQTQVRVAVDQLPERCRDLLRALYLNDPPLPYDEAAARLGMPLGSVGPTRARCLERLARVLEKMGFG